MRAVPPSLHMWLGAALQGVAAKKSWSTQNARTSCCKTIEGHGRSRAHHRVRPPVTEHDLQGPDREVEHVYCGVISVRKALLIYLIPVGGS